MGDVLPFEVKQRDEDVVKQHLNKTGIPIDGGLWNFTLNALITEGANDPTPKGQAKLEGLRQEKAAAFSVNKYGQLTPTWENTAWTFRMHSAKPNFQGTTARLRLAVGDGQRAVLAIDISSSHPTILACISGDQALATACQEGKFYESFGGDRGAVKIDVNKYLNGAKLENLDEAVVQAFSPEGPYAIAGNFIRNAKQSAKATGRYTLQGRTYEIGKESGPHAAIAGILQRAEAEIIFKAARKGIDSKIGELVAVVHDELVVMAPPELIDSAAMIWGQALMEAAQEWGLPWINFKPRTGWSWGKVDTHVVGRGAMLAEVPTNDRPISVGMERIRAMLNTSGDFTGWVGAGCPDYNHSLYAARFEYYAQLAGLRLKADWERLLATVDASTARKLKAFAKQAQNDRRASARAFDEDKEVQGPQLTDSSETSIACAVNLHYNTETSGLVQGIDGTLYSTKGALWEVIPEAEISRLIQSWHGVEYNTPDDKVQTLYVSARMVTGAIGLLKAQVALDKDPFEQSAQVLVCKDQLILPTGEVRQVTKDNYILATHSLDIDYDAEATCPRFDQFLDEVWELNYDREERKAFLQEFMGVALFGKSTKYRGSPMLLGSGSNGKSVLLNTLSGLFHKDSRSSVTLQNLGATNAEYYAARLLGSRWNVVAELPKTHVKDSTLFKAAATGDEVEGRYPNGRSFTFRPNAAFIYAANEMPSFSDNSDGFWDRLVPLSFDVTFGSPPPKPKPGATYRPRDCDLTATLMTERAGIINWAIAGYKRVMERGDYSKPNSASAARASMQENGDSVSAYCEEFIKEQDTAYTDSDELLTKEVPLSWVPCANLYAHYQTWAQGNGLVPVSSKKLGSHITQLYGEPKQKWIGKNQKCYQLHHTELALQMLPAK